MKMFWILDLGLYLQLCFRARVLRLLGGALLPSVLTLATLVLYDLCVVVRTRILSMETSASRIVMFPTILKTECRVPLNGIPGTIV
jgi:hypothetical protein